MSFAARCKPRRVGAIERAPRASGTAVSVIDMARFMIGRSDNTATDHLHEARGRARIDAWVDVSSVADPDVLRPLLKIKEQFHVFRTVARADADAPMVFTHAWMLERNGEQPLVLVALPNSPTASIHGNAVAGSDIFDIQSVTGRLLERMAQR